MKSLNDEFCDLHLGLKTLLHGLCWKVYILVEINAFFLFPFW